jgi:integrase
MHRKVLRYFLFSCFTSLRISDIKKINQSNIVGDTLVFLQEKNSQSQKIVKVPLTKIAQQFLLHDMGPLFDTYADQVTNRVLKEIADAADIEKNLTMHAARHTFAVMFLKAGGKVEVLKEIMGHADIKTTLAYVHIASDQKEEGMQQMEEYFKTENEE